MKKTFIHSLTFIILLILPKLNFGQAPSFGNASGFAVFSSSGAFTNVGPTNVTGDVGNNGGAFTAFPPGTLTGQIHNINAISAQAASSLAAANSAFLALACNTSITPALGGGQVVTPGTYCQTAVTTLTGDLILDAQGDANAVFIIKIGGTFTTATSSNVILINSASLCNVYWHVGGAIVLGVNSTFGGTILGNAALTLSDGATLLGRAFTTAGAVSLTNNTVIIASKPEASVISVNGSLTFCSEDSVILSGNVNGTWSNGATTPEITVKTSGIYFVTNSSCSVESNQFDITVNPLPAALAGNNIAICNGNNVVLGASPIIGNTYAWSPSSGLSSATMANPVASPSTTTTYILTETITSTGCINSNSVTVTIDNVLSASVISANGPTTFCANEFVVLSGNTGGTWSNTASVSTASLMVNTSGDYFVTNTNACNSVTSNQIIITVNPVPTAETGNDVAICDGNIASLGTSSKPGHSYSWTPITGLNSETSAYPYATPLISTIYTLLETDLATGCYNSNSIVVTVNPLPQAITVGNIAICLGQSVAIGGNSTTGNTYIWTPAIDLDFPSSSNPIASPTDIITYTLIETITATSCSNSNTVTVSVNSSPNILTQPADQIVILESPAIFIIKTAGQGNTYQWRKGQTNLVNGSNISGVDSDSLKIHAVSLADTSSSYNVVISGICLNSTTSHNASLSIETPTGIGSSDIEKKTNIANIFPNPFTNSINVVFNGSFESDLEISVYNYLGVKVMKNNLNSSSNIIETNNLSLGVYFYYIKSKDGQILQTGKLIGGN